MQPIGRNLTDPFDGFLLGTWHLLLDRDTKFCAFSCGTMERDGIRRLRPPSRPPNFTPHIERFLRSLKVECLHRTIFFGETSLRSAVFEFLDHRHGERNHQVLGNKIIEPGEALRPSEGDACYGEQLCGLSR